MKHAHLTIESTTWGRLPPPRGILKKDMRTVIVAAGDRITLPFPLRAHYLYVLRAFHTELVELAPVGDSPVLLRYHGGINRVGKDESITLRIGQTAYMQTASRDAGTTWVVTLIAISDDA